VTTTAVSDQEEPERADTEQPSHNEELRFTLRDDPSTKAAGAMTTRQMARRLPALVVRAVQLAWKVDQRAAAALLVCQVVSAVASAAGLLATNSTLTSLIASGHITARLRQAVPALVVLAATAGLRALLGIAVSSLSLRLEPRVGREAEHQMIDAALAAELSAYDHPGYSDRWDQAERGAQAAPEIIGESQNLLASAAGLVAAAVVLAYIHPLLLPLLVLAAIPQGLTAVRAARVQYEAMTETFTYRRILYLLRWWMIDKHQADQIRADLLAPFLMGKYRAAGDRVDAANDRAVWTTAKINTLGAAATGLASGIAWAVLVLLLATGHIGIAAAGTATFALRQAFTGLQGMVGYGAQIYRTGLFLADWQLFVDEAASHKISRGSVQAARPQVIAARKVSFTYPEKEREVLHEVSLELHRGEIVALIGENGSGKSTLLKLLCALNLPSAGAVEWDGVDTRELDPRSVWQHVATVWQNYARWPLVARENIQLGRQRPGGDDAVMRAAHASGADDVIGKLRSGLNTLLAQEFWGGEALSTGQWQRIAVARGAYARGALVVLDEPTADLDPRAEHRIFTGLRQLAQDATVVLVTHNLANASVADRLIVMAEGRIVQTGTLNELITRPGLTQELWQLQTDRPIRIGTAVPDQADSETAEAGTPPRPEPPDTPATSTALPRSSVSNTRKKK
jgi:ATP-binding cassette subfamily B protein